MVRRLLLGATLLAALLPVSMAREEGCRDPQPFYEMLPAARSHAVHEELDSIVACHAKYGEYLEGARINMRRGDATAAAELYLDALEQYATTLEGAAPPFLESTVEEEILPRVWGEVMGGCTAHSEEIIDCTRYATLATRARSFFAQYTGPEGMALLDAAVVRDCVEVGVEEQDATQLSLAAVYAQHAGRLELGALITNVVEGSERRDFDWERAEERILDALPH